MYQVRNALLSDVDAIYNLIFKYAQESLLLKRTINNIQSNIDLFFVVTCLNDKKNLENTNGLDKELIVGCISLFDYSNHLYEIRSLVVDEVYHKKGLGTLLIKTIEKKAIQLNAHKIFTLTHHATLFENLAYQKVNKQTLPDKIWKDCQYCQNKSNCKEIALVKFFS